MKFRITMKDPDGFYECVAEAVARSLPKDLSEREKDALTAARTEETNQMLRRWFEYSEYLTVEIDTEAKTLSVVENKP